MRHNPTGADIPEYFWSLVDKNGPVPDPATGSQIEVLALAWFGQGYGRFKAGGEIYRAGASLGRRLASPTRVPSRYRPAARTKFCVRHLSTRTRSEIMASVSRRSAGVVKVLNFDGLPMIQILRKGFDLPS
jgi:hypothetical protein